MDSLKPKSERITFKNQVDSLIRQTREDGTFTEWARYMCRHSLFFLGVYICNRKDLDKDWLYDRCQEVQESPDGHLDVWARDHYKSTIITYLKTIQDILIDPEIRICVYSYNQTIASSFVNQIKTELETNTLLKSLFPDILWEDPLKGSYYDEQGIKQRIPWTSEAIRVRRKSRAKEHTVESSGLVTGQKTGGHYNLLIYDDVVTIDSVRTPDMIKTTTQAFQMSLNTTSSADGRKRFIGTFYHYADTYQEIIKSGAAKPRIKPCVDEQGNPVLYSKEVIQEKKRQMGSAVFASQMMCDPRQATTMGFKDEWLRYWNPIIWANLNRYILVDPADAVKKKSDFTSMWVIGLGADNNFYVIDMVRDKLNLTSRTEFLFDLHRVYKPLNTFYEKVGMQADIDHILYVQEQRNYRFPITPVGAKSSKQLRIDALEPIFRDNRIYLPHELQRQNWEGMMVDVVQEFVEEEYKAYPFCEHDDALDALAKLADIQVTPFLTFPDLESSEMVLREKLSKRNIVDPYVVEDYIPF